MTNLGDLAHKLRYTDGFLTFPVFDENGERDGSGFRVNLELFREAADAIDRLLEAIRVDDPKTASGHCMFCGHRIGRYVFGVEVDLVDRHEPGCVWLANI